MEKIIIGNENIKVTVLTLGAVIQDITAFGIPLTAGFDSEEEYLQDTCYFGALIGRTANRTGDIFYIDGEKIILPLNEKGINHLHGGFNGFNRKRFKIEAQSDASLTLSCFSPDGEEGYTGNLRLFVTYSVEGNALLISYKASADKPTWVNFTNHSYFNPFGINSGKKGSEAVVAVYADRVSLYDENNRVAGISPVKDTEFDLNLPKKLHRFYDCNFHLNSPEYKEFSGKILRKAGIMCGNVDIEAYTDLPCMQLYCGEFIPENTVLSGGNIIGSGSAICFETQLCPNFQSRGENILRAGEVFTASTAYAFALGCMRRDKGN